MNLFATLNDRIITAGELTVPGHGNWIADITLQDGDPLASGAAVTLVLADMTLQGTMFRGAPFQGAYRGLVVGGADGWRKVVDPKGYSALIAGVKASTVIGDAAREVGETVQVDDDFSLGRFFARAKGPAGLVLGLVGRPWFMRFDGVTVVGVRDETTIVSHFDVISADLSTGIIQIATETPGEWLPGRHFASPALDAKDSVVLSVAHTVDKGSLRTEVWV